MCTRKQKGSIAFLSSFKCSVSNQLFSDFFRAFFCLLIVFFSSYFHLFYSFQTVFYRLLCFITSAFDRIFVLQSSFNLFNHLFSVHDPSFSCPFLSSFRLFKHFFIVNYPSFLRILINVFDINRLFIFNSTVFSSHFIKHNGIFIRLLQQRLFFIEVLIKHFRNIFSYYSISR